VETLCSIERDSLLAFARRKQQKGFVTILVDKVHKSETVKRTPKRGINICGEHCYSVCPKGRVTIPKEWRELLGLQVYVTRGLAGYAIILGKEYFEEVAEQLKNNNSSLWRYYISASKLENVDRTNGRVQIPIHLREWCLMEPGDDVVMVGLGDGIEVWPKALWGQYASIVMHNYIERFGAGGELASSAKIAIADFDYASLAKLRYAGALI